MGMDYTLRIVVGVPLKSLVEVNPHTGTATRFNSRTGAPHQVQTRGWHVRFWNGHEYTHESEYDSYAGVKQYLEETFGLETFGQEQYAAVGVTIAKSDYVSAGNSLLVPHPVGPEVCGEAIALGHKLRAAGITQTMQTMSVLSVSY